MSNHYFIVTIIRFKIKINDKLRHRRANMEDKDGTSLRERVVMA